MTLKEIEERMKNLEKREGKASTIKGYAPMDFNMFDKNGNVKAGYRSKYKNKRVEGSKGDYGLYYDSEGVLTSAIGHKIINKKEALKHANMGRKAAVKLKKKDVAKHDKLAEKLLKEKGIKKEDLTTSQEIAIKDQVYQLGKEGTGNFNKMFEAIKKGDFSQAAREAATGRSGGASNWYKQSPTRVNDFISRIQNLPIKDDYTISKEVIRENLDFSKEAPLPQELKGFDVTPGVKSIKSLSDEELQKELMKHNRRDRVKINNTPM